MAVLAGRYDQVPPAASGAAWIGGAVLAIAALAWAGLLHLAQGMDAPMAGMPMATMPVAQPWGTSDVALAFLMWVVMMTAMMAASALPVLLLFAAAQARRGVAAARAMTAGFGLGYLLAWAAFSALATAAQWALHDNALLSARMALRGGTAAGVAVCLAGAWQLLPLKNACLRHCRSPLGFLLSQWRDGWAGAVRMGLRHGAYCVGCCWALMLVLFVVGVMNLLWVAMLALLVLLEKLGPAGFALARLSGAALLAAGAWLIAAG